MTPQERTLLDAFLEQLAAVRGIDKDADAERRITAAVAAQPDAAYLLVQRALLQDQALAAATSRIAELEAGASQAAMPAKSFLDPLAWGRRGGNAAQATGATSVTGAPLSPAAARPAGSTSAAPVAARSGLGAGSFLGTAAATAAGVLGGAFLFQGMSHLLGGHAQTAAPAADAFTPLESRDAAVPASYAEETAAAEDAGFDDDDLADDDSYA